ncbi:LamG-like jellyroll fold domain-containing protein [Entomomonas asaccharolytica]|uniref:Laminin G domain-containing protein n=1 Tax=Entomomonas asaccharolytica TaxID=2785331 RepID=A0A974NGI6_9GAMM|nr:LamG-like jellyroll fold domain-containing protein [Entomomonas asaccharolytica]QQP86097.1 hypothetical protein JHT90_02260 [Entomomonas asaccharolytica]
MKIKKYILPLVLAVSASSAMADYKWYYNPQAIIGPFDSPYDLCNSLGADIKDMNPVYLITWGMTSPGRCNNPGGTGFFRIGSGCDSGKSYDSKQMSCEPDESDGPKGTNKRPEQCEGGGIADIKGQCNPQANPETNSCNPETLGNPILIATGQKVEITTDIELPNSLLTFSRNYWSSRLFADNLGLAWQHNWQMRIETLQSRDRIKLYRNNGRGIIFTPRNGRWESDSSDTEVITKLANEQGWEVQSKGGVIELYNNLGQLINYSKRGYPTVTLNYNTMGQLTTLTETSGRNLTLTYNTNDQITKVASNADLSVSYIYDSQNRLTGLTKAGSSKTYHYENIQYPNLLTGITDERGVRYATWTYNDKGQAISSEHAGGTDRYQFEYLPDNKTRVTNPLGKSAVYHFQDIRLEKKIKKIEGEPINTCIATASSYTYNAEGLPVYEYTKNNATINYEYNGRGLQTARKFSAQGLKYNIYTKWHDTLPLPVEINHNGQKQTYQYDNDGRLIQFTDGFKDFSHIGQGYDVALLQFDDFIDPAGNVWNLINNPQIVQDDEAVANNTLYLDGNAYLTTNNNGVFDFGREDFTIEMWVKPEAKTDYSATLLDGTFRQGDGSSFSTYITTQGYVYWQGYNHGTNEMVYFRANKKILDNQWHHIAYSRENGVLRIFIDGQLSNYQTDKNNYLLDENVVIAIGASASEQNYQYNYKGKIDQLRVTKKALYTKNFTPSHEPYLFNGSPTE